ncbi:hypothetical protein L6452_20937 [Arctium lappa]|uniref:Uncharacterized protein n=1 Tax=Arctium lappa TaxID=4217 RepID=A0ACB9BDK1_ARCLA|nr:hypothetical protein L6452_20937 [Arctium lappa]
MWMVSENHPAMETPSDMPPEQLKDLAPIMRNRVIYHVENLVPSDVCFFFFEAYRFKPDLQELNSNAEILTAMKRLTSKHGSLFGKEKEVVISLWPFVTLLDPDDNDGPHNKLQDEHEEAKCKANSKPDEMVVRSTTNDEVEFNSKSNEQNSEAHVLNIPIHLWRRLCSFVLESSTSIPCYMQVLSFRSTCGLMEQQKEVADIFINYTMADGINR